MTVFFPSWPPRSRPDVFLVRARKAGDIEAAFPEAETWEGLGTDYWHRAEIRTGQVAQAIADRIKSINYGNFKDSVSDRERHDAYMTVWQTLRHWGQGSG